jgi:hypothetical protein
MPYVILKHTDINGQRRTILVNDVEGIPMEWDDILNAEHIANLFQTNTTHDSVYEVKKIG